MMMTTKLMMKRAARRLALAAVTAVATVATVAAAGCSHKKNDLPTTDSGDAPKPSVKHVGPAGVTLGLITDGNSHAAYLLAPSPVMAGTAQVGVAGALHVVDYQGHDVLIAANVLAGGYVLAPDASSLFYIGFDPATNLDDGQATLQWVDLTAGKPQSKQVLTGMPVTGISGGKYLPQPLAQSGFYSATGRYFLCGAAADPDAVTDDLHVIDTTSGADVYQRLNGAWTYPQVVTADETLIFQDTAGGTGPTDPPVQTLSWVSLTNLQAKGDIATHTAQFRPTRDGKTLLVLKTNGDLQTWDLTGGRATPAVPPKTLASGVAVFTQGSSGQVAWLGADHSVHVVALDGTKALDLDGATAQADLFGGPLLVSDAVYFWREVEPQNSRGSLYYAKLAGGAPVLVAPKTSLADVAVVSGTLLFEDNVDDFGNFGNVVSAAPDGSARLALGTKAPVAGLAVGARSSSGWFAMYLSDTVIGSGTPADGSLPISGALALASAGGGQVTVNSSVHGFGISNSGFTAVYAGDATFNGATKNYVGSLEFVDTGSPSTRVDAKLAGVAELGGILWRRMFVSAPANNKPGIYYVSY
jgi:hypothetical protein